MSRVRVGALYEERENATGFDQQTLGERARGPAGSSFRFIDLFAGIDGLRLGFEEIGGQCVFASEWNRFSRETHQANFSTRSHEMAGDITRVAERLIPEHDVLLAGFPCQPFLIAGVSKKNSLRRPHGFACDMQGTLFFDVVRILRFHRPRAFLLENVKHLLSHDQGRTFSVIRKALEEELGYAVHWRVLDARGFVPQHRERLFIAGFREDCDFTLDALDLPTRAAACCRAAPGGRYRNAGESVYRRPRTGTREVHALGWTVELLALVRRDQGNPRRLTPRECARLMGFDEFGDPRRWIIPASDSQASRQ